MKYNNTGRAISLPIIIAASLTAGILIGMFMPGKESKIPHSSISSRNDKLGNIVNIIEANYVDSVSRGTLEEAAIPVMLKKLDPHSIYIPARDLKRANEPLEGNFTTDTFQRRLPEQTEWPWRCRAEGEKHSEEQSLCCTAARRSHSQRHAGCQTASGNI